MFRGVLRRIGRGALSLLLATVGVVLPPPAPAIAATSVSAIIPVSRGTTATVMENGSSQVPDISADGRYVVFESFSSNIGADDANDNVDVYLHDRQSGETNLVAFDHNGEHSKRQSRSGSVSDNGLRVAFTSDDPALIPGDSNGTYDAFVRDLASGETTLVSVSYAGAAANGFSWIGSISGDGQSVAFQSSGNNLVTGDTNGNDDVFIRSLASGETTVASVSSAGALGNGYSWCTDRGAISANGRRMVFSSYADNLVPADTNGEADVFLRDLDSGTTTRVSVSSGGTAGDADSYNAVVSDDGRYVAFESAASNLVAGDTNNEVDVFVRDTLSGTTVRASLTDADTQSSSGGGQPCISLDGSKVAFRSSGGTFVAGDTNNTEDIFVRDLVADSTTRVSVASDGAQGASGSHYPAMTADGRYVVFHSESDFGAGETWGSRVFLRDTLAGTTAVVESGGVSRYGDRSSGGPTISAAGDRVAFDSAASNLVPGDDGSWPDVFVHDLASEETTLVSAALGGGPATGNSYGAALSADGSAVAFVSDASDLIAGDTNGYTDAFVRDLESRTTTRVNVPVGGGEAYGGVGAIRISADGGRVAFESYSSSLVPGDTNGVQDIFVRDLASGETTRVSVATDGTEADSYCYDVEISSDGRWVGWYSHADSLVPGDGNGSPDVFVRDMNTGVTSRISVGPGGLEADGSSHAPSFSSDGRYMAFESQATNLVADDTNWQADVFVYDRIGDTVQRVSVDSAGNQSNGGSYGPQISEDGKSVAFISMASNLVPGDANGTYDVFVHRLDTGETFLANQRPDGTPANGFGYGYDLSGDGGRMAFDTGASNLAPDDNNGWSDVYVAVFTSDALPDTVAPVSEATGTPQGWSSTDVTVTLSATDTAGPGETLAGLAGIRYRVGGGTDATYTAPIVVSDEGTSTLEFAAVDNADNWETSQTVDVRVDKTAPVTLSNVVGHYGSAATITLSPSDAMSGVSDTFYRVDWGATQSGTTVTVSATGDHVVHFWSVDAAGNVESANVAHFTVHITVPDTVAPVSEAAGVPQGWSSTDVTVTLSATDTAGPGETLAGLAGIRYRVGGGTDATYTAPIVVSDEGTSTLEFAAVDNADNWETSQTVDVRVDKTAPVTLSNAVAHYGSVATITLSPSDAMSGVSDTFYRVDWGATQSGTTVTVSATGDHVVHFWSVDAAGNVESAKVAHFTVHTTFEIVAGGSRFDTAVEASKMAYPGGAGTVVIATARNWPDALGGSALAGVVGGPLLLTDTSDVPASVIAEITRLGATKAYVLGGTAAVKAEAETELKTLLGASNVTRIAGGGRYETARLIADEVIRLQGGAYDGNAFVATGLNFPDALGASPTAAAKGWPILLAPLNGMPSVPTQTVSVRILGGTKAVTPTTENGLKSALGSSNVSRVAGVSRYDTAAKAADLGVANGLSWSGVGIATGESFPDAMSGGAMLGRLGSVMLLTPSNTLDVSARNRLLVNRNVIGSVRYIGGTSAVSQSVRNAIQALMH